MVLAAGAFKKWLGQEGGVLVKGISAFIKEASEHSLACSTILRNHEKIVT